MKKLFFLFVFFLIGSCANKQNVYWCGDHPCINKKEKEAYFEKTMTVEIKNLIKNYKKKSEIEKIINQAKLDEKKRIKEEKDLARQVKLDEKRRIKEEKDFTSKTKLKKKKQIWSEKKLSKKEITKNQNKQITKSVTLTKFSELVEILTKKNSFRPYPNINDIPN